MEEHNPNKRQAVSAAQRYLLRGPTSTLGPTGREPEMQLIFANLKPLGPLYIKRINILIFRCFMS